MSNLPEGWVETTLGAVAYYVSNKMPVSEVDLDNYISTENLLADKMGVTQAATIPKVSKVNAFAVGDTLFSNIRTYFKKVWYSDKSGGASNDVLVFRPVDEEQLDKKYLYYLISNDGFIDYTVTTAKGTKMPRGDKDAIKQYPLNLPSLPEQKAIADMLSSFDEKIELLREQNKTLEALAQTIFKEWFVNFNCPDATGEMVASELGLIPKGWRVGKLGDVTSIKGGGTPSTKNAAFWNGEIHWTSPKDLSNSKSVFLLDTEKKLTQEGLKKVSSGLLPKGTLLLSSRAPIGYVAISNVDIAINQGYIALLDDADFSNYYMLFWLKTHMRAVTNAANGSTFLEISKSAFRNIDCVIPSESVLKNFDEFVKPTLDKVLENIKQIQTLSKIRDTLLPKLMSGHLRIDGKDGCYVS